MNHCVPDHLKMNQEDTYSVSVPLSSSCLTNQPNKKSPMAEKEELMELLWRNGQVVVQSQNQRAVRKSVNLSDGQGLFHVDEQQQQASVSTVVEEAVPHHLFIQENEMASWIHYPIEEESSFDRYPYIDLLCPMSTPLSAEVTTTVNLTSSPILPTVRHTDIEEGTPLLSNIRHSSRPKPTFDSGTSSNIRKHAQEFTVVDSNDTPMTKPESKVSNAADSVELAVSGRNTGCGSMSMTVAVAGESAATCELTVTSSSGGLGISVSGKTEATQKPSPLPAAPDRKRKDKKFNELEFDTPTEDLELETSKTKKLFCGSTSTKRSRAAEVHNLSERRRRDRINEKMKILQELIPRCNKSDKASMLDEAIEYLKSLQLQLQIMYMGCNMIPMTFPGVQQYMPPIGVGMGMGMGMNRPMVPFHSVIPGSSFPSPSAAHLNPRFPMAAFHMPPVPIPDSSKIQATNLSDARIRQFISQNINHPQMQNFQDPYQQYLSLQQMQVPLYENPADLQQNSSKPSSTEDVKNKENDNTG